MSYCTQEDILRELGQDVLVELTSDTGEVDYALVNEMIDRASAFIDSYLSKRYQVPLEPVPEVVKDAAIVVTTYFLYNKRAHAAATEIPQDLKDRYNQIVSWLKDVAKGVANIDGVTSEGQTFETVDTPVKYSTKRREFDDAFESAY